MSEPILFTENALRELERLRKLLSIPPSFGLRLETKQPAGAPRSYSLAFDEKKDTDLELTSKGLLLFIPKQQLMFISGMKVDYLEEEKGFVFLNPVP